MKKGSDLRTAAGLSYTDMQATKKNNLHLKYSHTFSAILFSKCEPQQVTVCQKELLLKLATCLVIRRYTWLSHIFLQSNNV